MTKFDSVIQGGMVALPTGLQRIDIGIKDGRIAALASQDQLNGDEVHDASGMLVVPGAIDMHVHFREPGFTEKEDFQHGTAAAICGGVTTICDMPNTHPPTVTPERLSEKLSLVSGRAHVDFALWAGGTRSDDFRRMDELGAIGLKVYMNRAVRVTDPYASELSMPDDAVFINVLRAAAELDWPVSVHVANSAIDEAKREQLQASGFFRALDVCCSFRSPESVEALSRAALFARTAGARLHIAHISLNSVNAIDALMEARRQGTFVTAEVVPPALSFDELNELGAKGIPFAHPVDVLERYWRALDGGIIDVVATDHAPHTRADKELGAENPWLAPPGYPGVETSLPIMIDAMLNKRICLDTLLRVCSQNPADILGLANKGALLPGRDADLNIVDPNAVYVVDERKLHSKAGWSPFHGRRLKGRITKTLLRGVLIAKEAELVIGQPMGRMVRRSRNEISLGRSRHPERTNDGAAYSTANLISASAFQCTGS